MEIPHEIYPLSLVFFLAGTPICHSIIFRIHQFFQMQENPRNSRELRCHSDSKLLGPKFHRNVGCLSLLVAAFLKENYPHPKDERVLPLKRDHLKRKFHLPTIDFRGKMLVFGVCTLERENHRLKGRKRDMSGQFPSSYPPKITINHIRGIISHIKRGKRCFSHDRKP